MEQPETEIEQLEVTFAEGMRRSFLSGVDVAVDTITRHLLTGCTLAEAADLTRNFWAIEFDQMQEDRALQELWRGVSGDSGRA